MRHYLPFLPLHPKLFKTIPGKWDVVVSVISPGKAWDRQTKLLQGGKGLGMREA